MAGRHERHDQVSRGGRLILLAAVLILVAAGVTAGVLASNHSSKSAKNGTGSNAGPSTSLRDNPDCTGSLQLRVVTAPNIVAPIRTIANTWTATHPAVGQRCVTVAVTAVASATEARALASSTGTDASVWIPDSTLWTDQLPPATAHVDASIATTPLVLVASPAAAAKLSAASPATGWSTMLAGKLPATIPDPTIDTDGLLALLALRTAAGSGTAASTQMVGAMIVLSHAALPGASAGFAKLAATPGSAPIFAASEQEVINANRAHHSVFAAAVYPHDGTFSLDYPVVRFTRAGDDPDLAAAETAFETQLRTTAARAEFGAAGLRDPNGNPAEGSAAEGVGTGNVTRLPTPTGTQATDAIRMWSAASQDSRLLAVIDVSGSMADVTANGQTKIQLVSDAAAAAVRFFPQTADIGLWVFSTNQTPTTDWAQLVSLGPLSAQVGGVSRQQALLAAAATMPSRVRGDTALYDTALAAFEYVRNTYDPSKVNTVVLMTDGRNVNPGGMTLDQLISSLRAQVDPARPVPIITIGMGSDVDEAALQAISAVTGGKTYLVKNPADIRGVFLDAILQRQCRPTC